MRRKYSSTPAATSSTPAAVPPIPISASGTPTSGVFTHSPAVAHYHHKLITSTSNYHLRYHTQSEFHLIAKVHRSIIEADCLEYSTQIPPKRSLLTSSKFIQTNDEPNKKPSVVHSLKRLFVLVTNDIISPFPLQNMLQYL